VPADDSSESEAFGRSIYVFTPPSGLSLRQVIKPELYKAIGRMLRRESSDPVERTGEDAVINAVALKPRADTADGDLKSA
jgi:hypothetical protein